MRRWFREDRDFSGFILNASSAGHPARQQFILIASGLPLTMVVASPRGL
jgi:hypothetical protein